MKIKAAHYQTGKVTEFTFADGRVVKQRPIRNGKASWLYGPGFFDIQCNGFAGVDYHHPKFSADGLRSSIHAMWRYGTTHVMPTIVTETLPNMCARFKILVEAVERYPDVCSSIPGFHQEGPYFANVEGVRGAHNPDWIVAPTMKHFSALQKAANGMIRMVTLAPEEKGALNFIREVTKKKVVIAIGHTNATPEEICKGVEAGAKTCTHLGNGSAQLVPRHHSYIMAQLGDDRLYASFIADGIHLPSFVLKSFLRAKVAEKRVLTTDAMAAAAAPSGRYTVGWVTVEVGRDRVVRQPGKPNFAGAAITMTEGFANAVRLGGVSIQEAWDMSSTNPWRLMKGKTVFPQPALSDTFIIGKMSGNKFLVNTTVKGKKIVYS